MVINSVVHAENRLGRPVFIRDIIDSMKAIYYFAIPGTLIRILTFDFYRNDELLGDNELHTYTARQEMQDTPTNPTGYELFSDRIKRIYPNYILNNGLRIIAGPKTETVNFT